MTQPLRIVDVINLASSAKEMLLHRLRYLHTPPTVENWVVCSAGPHVETMRQQGIPVEVVNTPRSLAPAGIARSVGEMTRFFRRVQPDIIHTHCSMPGLVGRVAGRLARVPIVLHTVHGFHFHDASGPVSRAVYSASEKFLTALSDGLLTENHEDLRVIESWGWPKRPAEWVSNGIEIDRYARIARTHTEPGRIVTCIGRFESVKNHEGLLAIFQRVHAACPEARLRLVGDGELRPACEAQATALGIRHVVDFLGYREDVEALLADTDVAVLMSWKEGMSRALLEPMAAGIPAVAWEVKGNRELIDSGVTGFLAAAGDRETTTQQIIQLLREPALRARLGAAAAAQIRERHDELRVVGRLRDAYVRRLTAAGYPLPSSWQATERTINGERSVLSA